MGQCKYCEHKTNENKQKSLQENNTLYFGPTKYDGQYMRQSINDK